MEVLKISETKMKIMLTGSDVKKYKLDLDNLDYRDAKTRSKVWEILDCVKKSHGFNAEGARILVQFYPSKDGSAEMFVTKLGRLPKSSERAIADSKEVALLDCRQSIYEFSCFEDLLKASKLICKSKCIHKSELFSDNSGTFYLEISERGASKPDRIPELSVLLEYSHALPREIFPYINEHFSRLTDGNALELLSRL